MTACQPRPPLARNWSPGSARDGASYASSGAQVEVHQIRRLADLAGSRQPQPEWAQLMARRRRKTLVVCPDCHKRIHTRQPAATLTQ